MRIAIGGIEHESSSFTPVETGLHEFLAETHFFDADTLRLRSGEANTVVDGFISGLHGRGVEIVPLISANAASGGQPTMDAFRQITARLLAPLRAALPVDGVLLSLHGSFSAQGLDDADGAILAQVRQLVGPECPVICVLDPHCNIGEQMVQHATALIIEDTYPHVDMADRGREAADLLVRTIRGEIRPTMAWRAIPMFWAAPKMITAQAPMSLAMDQVFAIERLPGVLTASISLGFQWADVPCAGASTIAITDGDAAGARTHAEWLARWIWERRDLWQQSALSPAEALARGEALRRYPIILADQADNTGGGAPGDSTEILRLFIDRGLRDAAVLYVVDPDAALSAAGAGVGATVDLRIGGRSHPLSGPAVEMRARVRGVSDGRFVYDGPMWAGRHGDLGPTAWIEQDGVHVVVISLREQPVDLALTRSLGLDCRNLRYLAVKSTGHFRSGFGAFGGSIFNVDASGVLSHDLTRLQYARLGRKVYPLDADAAL